jgi:hypothetical protein
VGDVITTVSTRCTVDAVAMGRYLVDWLADHVNECGQ